MNNLNDFKIASGSIIGRDHVLINKNNQDSSCIFRAKDHIIAVVTDGCGDTNCVHSEVGAILGAQMVCKTISDIIDSEYYDDIIGDEFWDEVCDNIVSDISNIMNDCLLDREYFIDIENCVKDNFLFTIVAAVIKGNHAVFAKIGDGTVFINGIRQYIPKYENNAPPYIAYNVIGKSLKFDIISVVKTNILGSFLIGSDGCDDFINAEDYIHAKIKGEGHISQFWTNKEYFSNPAAIRNRLAAINRDTQEIDWDNRKIKKVNGPLKDDITICVGARL